MTYKVRNNPWRPPVRIEGEIAALDNALACCERGDHDIATVDEKHVVQIGNRRLPTGTRYCRACLLCLPPVGFWRVEILKGRKEPWWGTVVQNNEAVAKEMYEQVVRERPHRRFRLLSDSRIVAEHGLPTRMEAP